MNISRILSYTLKYSTLTECKKLFHGPIFNQKLYSLYNPVSFVDWILLKIQGKLPEISSVAFEESFYLQSIQFICHGSKSSEFLYLYIFINKNVIYLN